MKFSTFSFLKIFGVAVFVLMLYVVSPLTVSAAGPATCSDGSTGCGDVGGSGQQYVAQSQCNIIGKANQGGQVCNTNDGVPGVFDANNAMTFVKWEGTIPSQLPSNAPYYSYLQIYNNTTGTLYYPPADDGGQVIVGGNPKLSYAGCTCGINDVTGNGCGNNHPSQSSSVVVSPGQGIDLQVVNQCKPNDNMSSSNSSGQYGGGQAYVNISDNITQCYTAAYFQWMVDVGQLSASNLGRDYYPDPNTPGRCDSDGTSVGSPKPIIGLTVPAAPIAIPNGQASTPFTFDYFNAGPAGSTLVVTDCSVNITSGSMNFISKQTCSVLFLNKTLK